MRFDIWHNIGLLLVAVGLLALRKTSAIQDSARVFLYNESRIILVNELIWTFKNDIGSAGQPFLADFTENGGDQT